MFHQCQAGLVDPDGSGVPVRKATEILASDERLIRRLRPLLCQALARDRVHRPRG